jgi:predicted phage terminase large subunit-like protein
MGILTPAEYRILLRRDFCSFVQRCFYELNPQTRFLWNPHIEVMTAKLAACLDGTISRLIINIPPRHLKSLCASIALPAWWLGHDPTAQILCASYGQELSDKLSRDCRTVMASTWYQRLFPAARLSLNKQSVQEFVTTEQGFRFATSVGGVLTGRGGDVIVIDDPLKPDEALSATQRKGVNEWYDHTLLSRLNSKQTGRIILIMQRLHEDDLVGHVLEQEPWEVVAFAAIAEHDETHLIETPLGQVKYTRHTDQVLHPERESAETLARIRTALGEYNFAGQYQQAPAPLGGGLVKEDWFKRYESDELGADFDQVVQSWDTANKPTELSDYGVCTTWGIKGQRLVLLHVLRQRLDYPSLKRAVREQWLVHRATVVLIEDRASGTQLIQELIEDGVHAVTRYKPEGDKLMRLHAQTATIENGFVYLPREAHWLAEYIHEITTFPNGKYDDQVDSTSQALAWTKQRSSADAWIGWARQQVEETRMADQIARTVAPNNRPWRRKEPVQQDGGKLTALYRATLTAALEPLRICAGCGETIAENTRISDGVDAWHVGCQGRVLR